MDKPNLIIDKTYALALKVIEIYKLLLSEKEYVLSKQFLRSGTSIGANVNEAVTSESKKDFVHKLAIALKEVRETHYWIRLLKDSCYITDDQFQNLYESCNEIDKIISSIIITTKNRYLKGQTSVKR